MVHYHKRRQNPVQDVQGDGKMTVPELRAPLGNWDSSKSDATVKRHLAEVVLLIKCTCVPKAIRKL